MKSNYKQLGQYIAPINIRNKDLEVETLLGVSVKKIFIPSIANTVGTDFKKYKIVKRNQFTYIPDTSRRGEKIGLAMLEDYEIALVSQAYTVFEITNHDELDPEYLMMWFRRPEFDRYARYKSHGSVREAFDWEEMCEVELPVPSIEKQRAIVKEYNTVVDRIELNEQLNQKLEETAQAIYKEWFVDFEFPANLSGTLSGAEGYKSSGGRMVWNDELDQEVPEGWETLPLVKLSNIRGGKRMPKGYSLISEKSPHPYIKVTDMGNSKFVLLTQKIEYVTLEAQKLISRYIVNKGDLIISTVGSIGIIKIIDESLDSANLTENCNKVTDIIRVSSDYLYHFLSSKVGKEEIEMRNVGAVQAKLPMYNIESLPILCPKKDVFQKFTRIIELINSQLIISQKENIPLLEMQNLLLSKMAKIELEIDIKLN